MAKMMRGLFETRRQAQMVVERLVQEFDVAADRVFISSAGDENTVGDSVAGADKTDGTSGSKPRDDAAIKGSVAVTVDVESEAVAEQVRQAFGEFNAATPAGDQQAESAAGTNGSADAQQERTRERAYLLWQEEGCPDGRDEEFWRRAVEIENAQPQMKEPELRESGPNFP